MHDAMVIVQTLEQSPVCWSFVLYKSWCVVQYFSPLLFQMKVIALLQQVMSPEHFAVQLGFDLAFFSLALCGVWQSFAEEVERWLK